jgi:hypothetical protein
VARLTIARIAGPHLKSFASSSGWGLQVPSPAAQTAQLLPPTNGALHHQEALIGSKSLRESFRAGGQEPAECKTQSTRGSNTYSHF